MPTVNGAENAHKAVRANMTPRACELDTLERYVEGKQYAGRPSWWNDEVPKQERAPCVVYKVVATAIASNVDLVLGEGRFPSVSANPEEDDEAFDDALLDPDDSEVFDRGVQEIQKQIRFRAACRAALAEAMGCGTAVAIIGIRCGRAFIDTVKAKWCERELDETGAVKRLVIQYPYTVTERRRDGSWEVVAKLYRRVIDEERDVTYQPLEAREDGYQPPDDAWTPDPAQTFEHGLGFCPVVWYAHMVGCMAVDTIDGHAIHELVLGEIEAHDYSISQRHSASLYCGDPQLLEFGVDPGYNPSSGGRTPGWPATPKGGQPSKPTGDNPVTGAYLISPQRARRKGVSQAWQYEDKDARAEYLTIEANALKPIEDNARDLRQKIAEALAVVFMDPENVKFAATVSGKALETLRERQLNRCDQIRDDFGDGFILPALSMVLRVVHVAVTKGLTLRLPGLKKLAPILAKLVESHDVGDGVTCSEWAPPPLTLKWGEYFKPAPEDESKVVDTAVTAKDSGIITKRTAVEKVRRIFGIENVDQYVENLEEEAEEHASAEAALAAMVQGNGGTGAAGPQRGRPKKGGGAAAPPGVPSKAPAP